MSNVLHLKRKFHVLELKLMNLMNNFPFQPTDYYFYKLAKRKQYAFSDCNAALRLIKADDKKIYSIAFGAIDGKTKYERIVVETPTGE